MQKTLKYDLFIAVLLITIALISRWVAHQWNFTAMGAVALMAGIFMQRKGLAIAVPLVALLITDVVIGFHNSMWAVYLGYTSMVLLAMWVQPKKRLSFVATSLLGSVIFYLISNFAVWIEGVLYPKTWEGLVQCYVMAVPFFRTEALSTVVIGLGLFTLAALNRNFLQVRA